MSNETLFIDKIWTAINEDYYRYVHSSSGSKSLPAQFAFERLLGRFFSKYAGDSQYAESLADYVPKDERPNVAFSQFMDMNLRCAVANLKYDNVLGSFSPLAQTVLGESQEFLSRLFQDVTLSDLISDLEPAKKSSCGETQKQHSFPFKYGLDTLFGTGYSVGIFKYFVAAQNTMWSRFAASVVSSISPKCSLSFVEKNYKTYRSIVTHRNLDMLLQQSVGSFLQRQLVRLGINLRSQSTNQHLARQGSISGEWATIDLTSASDTLSSGLVCYLLKWCPEVLNHLQGITCRQVSFKGEVIPLSMFSTMGCGYTFPLQTLVYFVISWKYLQCCGSKDRPVVYGDDIIVPSRYSKGLQTLLEELGFIPNQAKSYDMGPFRESCGADWYRGVLVTPILPKGDFSCEQYRIHSFGNLLYDWSSYHQIPIPSTMALINKNSIMVPSWEESTAGIRVPIEDTSMCFSRGYNKQYQCYIYTYIALRPESSFIKVKWDDAYVWNTKFRQNAAANALGVLCGHVASREQSIDRYNPKSCETYRSRAMFVSRTFQHVRWSESKIASSKHTRKIDNMDIIHHYGRSKMRWGVPTYRYPSWELAGWQRDEFRRSVRYLFNPIIDT